MAFPRVLKLMTVFQNGVSYLGETTEVTLPTLGREFADYRGGGLIGPIKLDMGQKAIDFEHKYGGWMRDHVRQFGLTSLDGVQLRFVGAYQDDSDGSVSTVEITIRGRHEEIDQGKAK